MSDHHIALNILSHLPKKVAQTALKQGSWYLHGEFCHAQTGLT